MASLRYGAHMTIPAVVISLLRDWRLWALLGVAALLSFLYQIQPERQVLRHQQKLLDAFAGKKWDKAGALIAPDFSTRWGQNRESVIEDARGVLQHYFVLDILCEEPVCFVEEKTARITTRIRMAGRGSPVAELVNQRANELRQPWTFEWVRPGWQTWKWELRRVEQPELTWTAM